MFGRLSRQLVHSMTMKLMHAFMVFLTVLLFFVRQSFISAGLLANKQQDASDHHEMLPPTPFSTACGDSFGVQARGHDVPKYKRDPDIDYDLRGQPHDDD